MVKPRNFVSKTNDKTDVPSTHIKSYVMTPNRLHLVTFEELEDRNQHKDIKI